MTRGSASPGTLLMLATRIGQMGSHSGYHLLAEAMPAIWPSSTEILYRRHRTPFPRVMHKLIQPFLDRAQVSPYYTYLGLLYELHSARRMRRGDVALAHLMFLDNDYQLLANRGRRGGARLVGTAHEPSAWWKKNHPRPQIFESLDGLIVMSREQIPFFEQYCRGPIDFLRLGVDTDFFTPPVGDERINSPPRFIACGSHLRDFGTLEHIISMAAERIGEFECHLVVSNAARRNPELARLATCASIHWHSGINDEHLRALYRESLAALLPLHDVAASNAVAEAMACGLPILATDLPGMRDYTTTEFASYFAPAAAEDYVREMQRLADDRNLASKLGAAARRLACETLALPVVARKASDFYLRVLQISSATE